MSNDNSGASEALPPPEARDSETQHLSQMLISPPLSPPETHPPSCVSMQEILRLINPMPGPPAPCEDAAIAYIHPYTPSIGAGRDGSYPPPSTLFDPELHSFINGCSLLRNLHTRYPSPEPLCSISSATPRLYKDPCAFCLYYSFLNPSTQHRPLRDSYSRCTLYAGDGKICGYPSLFHCHYCDNVVCKPCQSFFQREFEAIQLPKPLTMRKRFAQAFGPVNSLSILSTEFQNPAPALLLITSAHSLTNAVNNPILISDEENAPAAPESNIPAKREGSILPDSEGALFDKNAERSHVDNCTPPLHTWFNPSMLDPTPDEELGTFFLDGGCVSIENRPNIPLTTEHKLDGVFFWEAKCVKRKSSFALVAYHHQACYITAKRLTQDYDSSDSAHFHALLRAISFAQKNQLKHILLITSSELTADFIKGLRRPTTQHLNDIATEIQTLFRSVETVFVSHINAHCSFMPELEIADALCTWTIKTGLFLGCDNPCKTDTFLSPLLNRMHASRPFIFETNPLPNDCPLCFQQHQASDCPISLFSQTRFLNRCEGCYSPAHSSKRCPTASIPGRRPVLSPLSLRDNWFVSDGLQQGDPFSPSAFIAASRSLAPSL